MRLTVDVISDVICPWCYIGKRRLERAIAMLEGEPVTVRWLPYQLNPTMPLDGLPRREYRVRKFGTWERSQELDAQVAAVGKEEGISFAFERIERTPNTLDAHRLVWLADQEGCQDAVVESFFRSYFTEGHDLGHRAKLIDIAVAAGLDRTKAGSTLDSDVGMEAVREAAELSRQYRVSGVPFFIFEGRLSLAGAQSSAMFVDALRQAS